jgi:hypothetical protein
MTNVSKAFAFSIRFEWSELHPPQAAILRRPWVQASSKMASNFTWTTGNLSTTLRAHLK